MLRQKLKEQCLRRSTLIDRKSSLSEPRSTLNQPRLQTCSSTPSPSDATVKRQNNTGSRHMKSVCLVRIHVGTARRAFKPQPTPRSKSTHRVAGADEDTDVAALHDGSVVRVHSRAGPAALASAALPPALVAAGTC